MTTSLPRAAGFRDLPRLAQVNVVLLGAAVVAMTVLLWPEWTHNPDLSHGLFMPVVFGALVHESRRSWPRFLPRSAGTTLACLGLLAAALAALVAAGLYAAAIDWSHPLVNYALTIALMCFLGAGLIVLSSESLRFVGCNWSAVVGIVLWLLCTPIPPGTYSRLTLTLQLWISEGVLRALHLLGFAAMRHGNIIELARTTVGVEEACSGVRSLLSCIFAGLFFSATMVRRPWARALIIGLSAPLALGMNFIRSLTLTLLANANIDISGAWHDLTGFAVLGITAALLGGLAFVLERHSGAPRPSAATGTEERPSRLQLTALAAALGIAAILVFVSIANTRPSVRRDAPAPDLLALLPAEPAGWVVKTSDDLYQFRDTLQTDHLAQRIYRKVTPDGDTIEITIYVAYWHAGQAPVSLVASHTPDACWPGSGWTVEPTAQPRAQLRVGGRTLPDAEYRSFKFGDFPQHVWFWHIYDGRAISYRDPYSAIELLRIAWRYGFRHDGDQLFIRISSNRPWKELADDPLLAEFVHNTASLGL